MLMVQEGIIKAGLLLVNLLLLYVDKGSLFLDEEVRCIIITYVEMFGRKNTPGSRYKVQTFAKDEFLRNKILQRNNGSFNFYIC